MNKKALVSAARERIGQTTAKPFAALKDRLILTGRRVECLQPLALLWRDEIGWVWFSHAAPVSLKRD